MKFYKVMFLVVGMGLMFASCGAHKGSTCPAYKTDVGSVLPNDEIAVEPATRDSNFK